MAWVSPKVYAILSSSEEGKDIIERLPDLTQDECQEELDAFFGNGGKGASSGNDYLKAKQDDEFEEETYKHLDDEDLPWWDKPDEDEVREAYGDDFEPTRENILNKQKETENAFSMPESEGWKPSNQGEKSFIKNEGKDNEMFIQYNGQDYDGSNQEYVAGYMKNGDYISKKFDNLEDAKDFLNNVDDSDEKNSYKLANGEIMFGDDAVREALDDFYGYAQMLEDYEKGSKGWNRAKEQYDRAVEFLKKNWKSKK